MIGTIDLVHNNIDCLPRAFTIYLSVVSFRDSLVGATYLLRTVHLLGPSGDRDHPPSLPLVPGLPNVPCHVDLQGWIWQVEHKFRLGASGSISSGQRRRADLPAG